MIQRTAPIYKVLKKLYPMQRIKRDDFYDLYSSISNCIEEERFFRTVFEDAKAEDATVDTILNLIDRFGAEDDPSWDAARATLIRLMPWLEADIERAEKLVSMK